MVDVTFIYVLLFITIHQYKGVAVKKPNVRLPYSKIKDYGISAEGLPENKDLKHPSSYGINMLQAILDNSELITIKGT